MRKRHVSAEKHGPAESYEPVDDASLVQSSQSNHHLNKVESRPVTTQAAPSRELRRQVPSGMKIEREIQRIAIMKGVV